MMKLGLLLLALVPSMVDGSSYAWGVKSFAHTGKNTKASLAVAVTSIPRGGGCIDIDLITVEPDLAAKIFIGAYGANAALCFVASEFALKTVYGGKDAQPDSLWGGTTLGAVGCNTALLLYLQHFKGMGFEKAIGWSVLPYLTMEFYRIFINPDSDKVVGMKKETHYAAAVLNIAVLVASLMEASWAPKLNWIYGLFSLMHGVWYYVNPQGAMAKQSINMSGPFGLVIMRTFGYFLLTHFAAVCGGLHITGTGTGTSSDVLKVTGWTALMNGVSVLSVSLDGTMARANMPVLPGFAWAILSFVLGGSLVLKG